MNVADEIDRLHSQYSLADHQLFSFLMLAKQAIDEDALNTAIAFRRLQTIHEASKSEVVIAVPSLQDPDGSAAKMSLDQVAERLKQLNTHVRDVAIHFQPLALRMVFVSLVAQFDAFLTDVLEVALVADPRSLKSGKEVRCEEIIDCATMEDVLRHLAKRELYDFGYKSIRDQATYLQKKFGIDVAASGVKVDDLAEIHEARNLLLHNNGIINEKYLKIVSGSPYKKGEAINISGPYWQNAAEQMRWVVHHIAHKLKEKMGCNPPTGPTLGSGLQS